MRPMAKLPSRCWSRPGLWDQLQPKLVLAESVEQTAQFLRTGNAEAAIIAWSVAESPEIEYQLIESSLHLPLRHTAAVVADSPRKDLAGRFLQFVVGTDGQSIMRQYGFAPVGEG